MHEFEEILMTQSVRISIIYEVTHGKTQIDSKRSKNCIADVNDVSNRAMITHRKKKAKVVQLTNEQQQEVTKMSMKHILQRGLNAPSNLHAVKKCHSDSWKIRWKIA